MSDVRGISKFRGFNESNVIKVLLTNGQEFKGIYVGTENINQYRKVEKGQFLLVYDVANKNVVVLDIISYCSRKKTHIKDVGAARLVKGLGEYLKQYYKAYSKQQAISKELIIQSKKLDEATREMYEVNRKDLGNDVIQSLEEDLKKNDIEDWLLSKLRTGLSYMTVDRDNSRYTLELMSKFETDGGTIGASTYLEYDDTRCIDRAPSQKEIVKYLCRVSNFPSNSEEWYSSLVKKYSKWFKFNDTFLSAYLRDGKGDRFRIYVGVCFELTGKNKLTPKVVESFINDLDRGLSVYNRCLR